MDFNFQLNNSPTGFVMKVRESMKIWLTSPKIGLICEKL